MSRNLADCPQLCAWRLENLGMFRTGHSMDREWRGDIDLAFDDPGTPYRLVASWDGELPWLEVRYAFGAAAYRWTIELLQSQSGHIYFKCPISGRRVLDLYVWGRTLGSRTALRLRYPCQQVTAWEWWALKQDDGFKPSDLGHDPMPKRRYTRPTPPQKLMDPKRAPEALAERAKRRRSWSGSGGGRRSKSCRGSMRPALIPARRRPYSAKSWRCRASWRRRETWSSARATTTGS